MAKVAAGFVIFRKVTRGIEYLMLQTSYGKNHWTPPKGHVDPGEDEFTTAKRETEEEAGLKFEQYKVIDNFKETLSYPVRGRPKIVYYYLAELMDPMTPVILSEEHINFKWCNLEEAKEIYGREGMSICLEKAENLIKQLT